MRRRISSRARGRRQRVCIDRRTSSDPLLAAQGHAGAQRRGPRRPTGNGQGQFHTQARTGTDDQCHRRRRSKPRRDAPTDAATRWTFGNVHAPGRGDPIPATPQSSGDPATLGKDSQVYRTFPRRRIAIWGYPLVFTSFAVFGDRFLTFHSYRSPVRTFDNSIVIFQRDSSFAAVAGLRFRAPRRITTVEYLAQVLPSPAQPHRIATFTASSLPPLPGQFSMRSTTSWSGSRGRHRYISKEN